MSSCTRPGRRVELGAIGGRRVRTPPIRIGASMPSNRTLPSRVVAFSVTRAAFDRPVPTEFRPGSHVTTTRPLRGGRRCVTPNQTSMSGLRRSRRVGSERTRAWPPRASRAASRPTAPTRSRRGCAHPLRGARPSPARDDSVRRRRASACRSACSRCRSPCSARIRLPARSSPRDSVPPVSETSLPSITAVGVRLAARGPRIERVHRHVVAIRESFDDADDREVRATLSRRGWLREAFADEQDRRAPRRGAQLAGQRAQRGQHDLRASRLDQRRRAAERFLLELGARHEVALASFEASQSRRAGRRGRSVRRMAGQRIERLEHDGRCRRRAGARRRSASPPRARARCPPASTWNSSSRIAIRRGCGPARFDRHQLLDDAVLAELEVLQTSGRSRACPAGR